VRVARTPRITCPGCGGWSLTPGVSEPVRVWVLSNPDEAQRERFLGSPTVRVNGRDVDPTAHTRRDYGLSCRLYASPDGLRGTPADEWVLTMLRADAS
jgi:hypothetical protein